MIDWARRRLADWLDRLAGRVRPAPAAPVVPLHVATTPDAPHPPHLLLVR